jgi:hypothetical protein
MVVDIQGARYIGLRVKRTNFLTDFNKTLKDKRKRSLCHSSEVQQKFQFEIEILQKSALVFMYCALNP